MERQLKQERKRSFKEEQDKQEFMSSAKNDIQNDEMDSMTNEEHQIQVFNDIIENKIGFGFYQKRALFILSLIDLNDGCEYIIISIVLPIIREEWNDKSLETNPNHQHLDSIDNNTFKWLTSIVFIGMLIGSLMTGYFSDKYGRKKVIQFCSLLYSLICFYSLAITELYELFIQRFLQGLIFAVTIPLSTTIFTEISPLKYRGLGVMFINIGITVGLLFGIFLSWMVLDDIGYGNWRLLTALQFIQGAIVFIGSQLYLFESPRYLLVSNQVTESIHTMNQMIQLNQGINYYDKQNENIELEPRHLNKDMEQQPYDLKRRLQESQINHTIFISNDQKNALLRHSKKVQHDSGNSLNLQVFLTKLLTLFKKENRKLTIFLGLLWFINGFIAFGQIIAIPLVFQEQKKKSFLSLFVSFLGEIPSYFVFHYIFNDKEYRERLLQ